MTSSIGILIERDEDRPAIEAISARFQLPTFTTLPDFARAYLRLDDDRLCLWDLEEKQQAALSVDFLSGPLAHRRHYGGGRRQLIGRAVGIKPGKTLQVLDVTAGLGRDAYVLATLGCHMTLVEQHPVVAALLEDGCRRGRADEEFAGLSFDCHFMDSQAYMAALTHRPDVVYMDPMFSPLKKSALVKKEMRVLKKVVGPDAAGSAMLKQAISIATSRVVVKRHRHAECLRGPQPSLVFQGKSTRFDVYICRS